MLRKITVIAVLIALVVAALPTAGVLAAKGTNTDLEKKWGELLTNFDKQEMNHVKAHKWMDAWLLKNKNAKDRSEMEFHFAACNTYMTTAHAVVARHAGFNAKGKVINRNLAYNSIKDLSAALTKHAASVKNMQEHLK